MADVKVYDMKAKEVGSVALPAELFSVEYNEPVIHQVIVAENANARQGTKSTLTVSEVRGHHKKPYAQKHTGNARHGNTKAPQYKGGGIVHAADGYVVPGNSFSGDRVPALLNSGEVVLNRAQQNTLASELQGSGGGSDRYMPSFVSGEQIWVALNAYTKRTGRGEVVTWR